MKEPLQAHQPRGRLHSATVCKKLQADLGQTSTRTAAQRGGINFSTGCRFFQAPRGKRFAAGCNTAIQLDADIRWAVNAKQCQSDASEPAKSIRCIQCALGLIHPVFVKRSQAVLTCEACISRRFRGFQSPIALLAVSGDVTPASCSATQCTVANNSMP